MNTKGNFIKYLTKSFVLNKITFSVQIIINNLLFIKNRKQAQTQSDKCILDKYGEPVEEEILVKKFREELQRIKVLLFILF